MEQKQFEEIKEKIDVVIRLLALNLVKDSETNKDKIITLHSLGFKSTEIAKLLGIKANVVRATLSKFRREKRRKSKSDKTKKESAP